jgi:uncharacterized membrane protein YfcA
MMPTLDLGMHLLGAAAAFVISLVSATAGLTGAFLLVPFQVSVLGLGAPSVSGTNHFYNVVAAPGGFTEYRRQGRLLWPVALVMVAGTAPGVLAGVALRVRLLPDPSAFRQFAGGVLAVLGLMLLFRLWRGGGARTGDGETGVARMVESSWRRIRYSFAERSYSVRVPPLFLFSAAIGAVGGAYGVGGGIFTSAYLVGVCGLPIHTTAGATLLATFAASCFGALGFAVAAWSGFGGEHSVSPLWSLGAAMGVGGLLGGIAGARIQRRLPSRGIAFVLAVFLLALGAYYILHRL